MAQPIVPPPKEHLEKLYEESFELRQAARITLREAKATVERSRQTIARIHARRKFKIGLAT